MAIPFGSQTRVPTLILEPWTSRSVLSYSRDRTLEWADTIHFHMSGTIDQSYVLRCSIHHTYNRAVAIHGVHGLRVVDNVNYDVTP